MKLNVKAFSVACALLWGIGMFLMTWWVMAFEGATHEMTIFGHLYRGYNISAAGSIIGLVWGFADGLVGGAVFAWLYNAISKNVINASKVTGEVELDSGKGWDSAREIEAITNRAESKTRVG